MDATKRQITKIAREVNKFTARMLKLDCIGTAEYDFLHVVRKNPGITQAAVREILTLDKGAAARRAANLEAKGYLVRKANPADGRSQLLYATEKADRLKNSKASVEALYYEYLLEALSPEEIAEFCRLLEILYTRSKEESKGDFSILTRRFLKRNGEA
ncbi:MarR family winged helix-turn-helix transcriptional regulator [Pygmaiobacter massiliensis]|uniref:MarR family winged helix-turn-helix transcriptional regulator n=1 Tax=Pygmaiobacter massiliensis TaxID=1917873 RepID=UPI0028A1968F|nr:helix-turn-helix domain-containing protein [Pygmaiobacter massiliensis]